MSINVAYDIWNEFRRYLSTPDRADAADTLISVLIDHDYDADEINTAFKGDDDIRRALQSYLDDELDDEIEEDVDDPDDY